MEWTNILKRTRNGSIYSETASTLTKFEKDANKRQKTTVERDNRRSTPCALELLPAELLQQIFLTSMNGNLLTASPRIAVKLSGSKAFYRAAFLLAFYSHDVENMFDMYCLHYMVPMLDLPFSNWDVRSMTKAVLDSRWCTCGQVERWLSDNLRHAVTRLLAVATPSNSTSSIQKFMQGETHMKSLLGTAWWAKDEENRSWQLETCMWDIRLVRDSDIDEDKWMLDAENRAAHAKDTFTAEWHYELMFQCQMRILGVLTIGDEKKFDSEVQAADPFRKVIASLMGFEIKNLNPQTTSVDFWQLLDDRAIRATRNSHWLRETLAIEYFFYPEDQPLKVPPRLYRAAAACDLKLQAHITSKRYSYVPILYALFEVDPMSLPREEPVVLAWAARARVRILHFFQNMLILRDELNDLWYIRGGTLKKRDQNKFRSFKLEHMYTYEQDWKIVNYIATGVLDGAEPNRLAPNFTERLGWLGERLSPSPLALDEAERASYPRASERNLDIFQQEPPEDYDDEYLELQYDADYEVKSHICHLFGRNQLEVNQESRLGLDKNAQAEARYALTTHDSYYVSMDHDGYENLFRRTEPRDEAEWSSEDDVEDWESDDDDDDDENADEDETIDVRSDTDGQEYMTLARSLHRGLLHETPIVVPRNLAGVDSAILFPDARHPLPPTDTELINPLHGHPKWFHVSEKSYILELRSIASV